MRGFLDGDSVWVVDGEGCDGGWPVGAGSVPSFGDVVDLEVDQLTRCVLVGEVTAASDRGAQFAVERFDLVGGVDDPAQLWWEAEEGGYSLPVCPPAVADH